MLHIKSVSEELALYGLREPDFPFLDRNPNHISTLLFQPTGTIVADDHQVRVRDRSLLTEQMKAFLSKASELHADLAACPEYSCTWDALFESISNNVFPSTGKLWAIACESANREQILAEVERLSSHVTIVLDETYTQGNGNFLDCLCYLFVARDENGNPVKTILFQLKTNQMGGDDFESANLILGNKIYRFGRDQDNRLVGLLCSDTLSQPFENLVQSLLERTLIVHLQLNPRGDSPGFRNYRIRCCNHAPRDTEILCLNWAKNTKIQHELEDKVLIGEPRTILFRDTDHIDGTDERISENHKKGCYLTYWKENRSAAYIFSPDPQLFFYKTTKPFVAGIATNARKTGIIMVSRHVWNESQEWELAAEDSDDRFKSYWIDNYQELHPILVDQAPSLLDTERTIQICIGYGLEKDWAHWKNLPSFQLASDDTAKRLRLCWSHNGEGYNFRSDCLSRFRGFVTIVAQPMQFSPRLIDFKQFPFTVGFIGSPSYKYHRNLHIAGGSSATAIYMGQMPPSEKLVHAKKKLIAQLADIGADTQLVAIWYQGIDGSICDYMDGDVPAVNSDPRANPVAFDEIDQ